MSVPETHTVESLDTHTIRRISVEAHRDPRVVVSVLRGRRCTTDLTQSAVADALQRLGLRIELPLPWRASSSLRHDVASMPPAWQQGRAPRATTASSTTAYVPDQENALAAPNRYHVRAADAPRSSPAGGAAYPRCSVRPPS